MKRKWLVSDARRLDDAFHVRRARARGPRSPRGAPLVGFLAVLALAAGACGSVAENPYPFADLARISVEPARYLIQPGDELEIKFFHTPDLDLVVPVRPDGYVSVPFGEEVRAAGRTPEEVDRELTERLSSELREPVITVIVRTFSSYMVHVGGEVDQPGVLPLTAGMTVLQAVFEAGGFLEDARLYEVLLMRKDTEGHYVVVQLDLEHAIDGTDTAQNVALRPFDAIFVPRTPIGEVNVWVDQYLRQMIPINFGVRPSLP